MQRIMNVLRHATLEEALTRVVIPLKRGNSIADAVKMSRFLNSYDSRNPLGVLPIGDDLIEFSPFSSNEYAITLLPEEVARTGRETNYQTYVDRDGKTKRYFNEVLGKELDGKTVYIIATPSTDPNWQPDQIVFRMQVAARTAKHIGAKYVFAVFSEFPFARQDRGINLYNRITDGSSDRDRIKHAGQTDYVSSVLLGLLVSGCDGLVTLHHHSDHVQKAINDCLGILKRDRQQQFVFNLNPTPLIARYLQQTDILTENEKKNNGEGLVFIAPDKGALDFVRTVKEMTGYTNALLSYIDKTRLRANDPGAIKGVLISEECYEGNYEGRTGIVLDDMIDTFGTMNTALNKLPSPITKVVMYATHGIFGGQAEDRMRRHRRVTDVIVMDTRPSRLRKLQAGAKRKITILQPAEYIAHALVHCVEGRRDASVFYGELFQQNPAYFDSLFKVKRFDQHYSKQ